MSMDLSWILDPLKQVSAIGGMLTPPSWALWRFIVRPRIVLPIQKHITDMAATKTAVDLIAPKVDAMSLALGPNGGTSLADSIRRSEARQVLMLQTLPWPTWEANAHGENTRVNVAFERMFQYSSSDLHGNGWKSLLHPDDFNDYVRAWSMTVKDKRDFDYPLVRFRSRDGYTYPVHVSAYLACSGRSSGKECSACSLPTCIWMGTVRGRDMEPKASVADGVPRTSAMSEPDARTSTTP